MVGHVTAPVVALAERLPEWITLVRAPNPGPMTLDGTNSWVLTAPRGRTVVVDPGPADEGHLARLLGYRPSLILVTHGHPDHVEGLPLLGDIPVWRATEERRSLAGLDIQLLATPGHTDDSVCFRVEVDGERAVLTGDTILGRGTTIVDGDLGDYLRSLERLEGLGAVPVLPGHGPALADCGAAARAYLDHRLARLAQVRDALAAGARTAREVVEVVYADVDRAVWPAAEATVAAQLAYLESSPPDVRWDTP
ncbi:MAG: MBL fold metallo-hydrolase [Actinobacteria bacterium 13_2_20CM_2_71_6]|nr:MAG: MBL fold metallo-hydrolase [Actinobacteria bacterium 13_2_20CM_2_71_6]